MRSVLLVCYDISDDRRLRLVYRHMRGRGDHVQLSVFRCELSARERAEMVAELSSIIDHAADQILFVDLGPNDGRGADCIQGLGRTLTVSTRNAVIV